MKELLRKALNAPLHWQIFTAMGLGVLTALSMGDKALTFQPLGDIFMRLLKMLIVPLIFSSITSGVASLGDSRSLGRLSMKTILYYMLSSFLAIVTGLLLTNWIRPGLNVNLPENGIAFNPEGLQTDASIFNLLLRMIPTNPISAMAEGDILAVIFFSIFLGMVITMLPAATKERLSRFFDTFFAVMMKMTHLVIRLAPIGVFGLITTAVASSGFELFQAVGLYFATIAAGLLIHFLVTLPLLLWLFTRIFPPKHLRALSPALGMAFSSSSSAATLPLTMDCLENNSGVSNKVSSFVAPLGATVNMDGTALYECAGVLFIAQVLGFELGLAKQLIVVITAFLASVGAAAIPSAGLVMIFIVLEAVGLGGHPTAGLIVGTMLAVDRPLDMFRTMTNVWSDSIGTVIIARSEGEKLNY
ncbi:MAG TPA: dicarboxylate/amino acid:cation symporter [Candidatus Marinimicrobia bacterium]|nr:dicarboxylate/amino acid:cation symporter [Candidatus Neomarinimicrobiota bacterium]